MEAVIVAYKIIQRADKAQLFTFSSQERRRSCPRARGNQVKVAGAKFKTNKKTWISCSG